MKATNADAPQVIALPPLLFGGFLLAGLALHLLWPVRPLPPVPARALGALLVAAAIGLAGWGESVMRAAGTNVRPDRPTLAIVTGGPFRFTRNPLYIASTSLYVGVALLFDALAPLLLLAPLLVLIDRGVVRREEIYLEAKFGETYRSYRRRVRRWI